MSIIKRIFGLGVSDAPHWLSHFSAPSFAGKSVNLETSLPVAANLACIRANAQAVAQMPLQMFKEEASGGRVRIDHALAEIISRSPNADQTAIEFWESMVAWLLARGNAFALIELSGDRIAALTPLPAEKVEVFRDQAGDLKYRFNDRGKVVEFPADSVFHVKGFGFGGDVGLDPIRYGAQVLGISLAAEEVAGKMLGTGLTPSVFWKVTADTTPEQRTQIKEIVDKFTGSSNIGKNLVLPGIEPVPLSIDPEALSLLSTRRFNVELVCVLHGTPPAIIGFAAENTTQWGTGIEALQLQWLSGAINPLAKRIEQRIRKQLLRATDRNIYAEFNRESILQTDSAAKANFVSKMINCGETTIAEAREKGNKPFIKGTDVVLVNSNMLPLDKLGAAADARSAIRNALQIEDEQ